MVREFGQNDSAPTFKGLISKTCRINSELDATRMYNTGRIKKKKDTYATERRKRLLLAESQG